MKSTIAEAAYPLKFRDNDSHTLADHLVLNHSVELIGMKRVGINNFLRFFFFHKHIEKKFIQHNQNHLFILVDLNDLVEKDLFAFWRLTLKRIIDAMSNHTVNTSLQEKIGSIFLRCIQTGDFFLTYDGVRESIVLLTKEGISPTLFFTRFDRLKDIASIEFFDNLKSIKDASEQKLSYVFTSFREIQNIFPAASENELISRFISTVYIRPLGLGDQHIVIDRLIQKYTLTASPQLKEKLLEYAGGHIQYLHLSVIICYEQQKTGKKHNVSHYLQEISDDERIRFLSEELWESLTSEEQTVIKKIIGGKNHISADERLKTKYLSDTGIVLYKRKKLVLFSPLFADYIAKKEQEEDNTSIDLSKKEHVLFQFLKSNLHAICEREKIAEIVWPEYKDYGVSDWSIDRLIARVRGKLKKQKSIYELITIRTRGYKLILSQDNQ